MAFGNGPRIVTNGLVLSLDAADRNSYPGSGTTWRDLGGSARNGTLNNGVNYSSNNGGYLIFDGADDYISNINNTGIEHGTNEFSYFAWINLQGKPSLGTIFENGSWTSCLLIRYQTDGIDIYSMGTYSGRFSFNPSLNTWNHIGVIRRSNTLYFYANGINTSTIAFSVNIAPSPNIFIGTSQHSLPQCFNGYISNAQIYTRALADNEILQNYNVTKTRFGL